MRNTTVARVRRAIRHKYAWPGGYPVYTVLADGALLCADCARANYRLISEQTRHPELDGGWCAAGAEIYWEGPSEPCGHCGKPLESAYGDPDATPENTPCTK